MSKFTKTIATMLVMVIISLSAGTIFSACSGDEESMTENTVEISDLQISYTSETDSPLGEIDEDSLVSSLDSVTSETYYVVIDFGIRGAEGNKKGLSLVTNFSVDDNSVLGLRLDYADTGSSVSSDSSVELSYSLPEKAGSVKTERIVFKITPVADGYAVLHLSFSCEGKDIVGYFGDEWTVKISESKITTIETFLYEQYRDSNGFTYVNVVGINEESKVTDLYIRQEYDGLLVFGIQKLTDSFNENISYIYIPATLAGAGLTGCFLKGITVDVNNPYLCSIDGNLYSYDYEDGWNELALRKYAGDNGETVFTVPDGVNEIAYRGDADDFKNLTDIVFPDSMISLGADTDKSNGVIGRYTSIFAQCTNLQETEDGLIYVGDWVVDVVDIAESRSTYNIRSGTKGIGCNVFMGTSISEITIPDSVISVDGGAFESCISLTTVIIGSGAKYISYWAFCDCSALKSVTFKNTSGWRGGQYVLFCSSLYESVDVTDSAYNAELVVNNGFGFVRDD